MKRYVNLDKLNEILQEDTREAFTKQQVRNLLNGFPDLVIQINDEDEKTFNNKVKKELENAGRYDEVISLLFKMKWNNGVPDKVSDDAQILIDILESDEYEWDKCKDLQYLRVFVNSHTINKIYDNSEYNFNNISSSWLILNDLLSHRFLYGDINDWVVPKSLRKKEDEQNVWI